jgi:hypothetical protein
LAAFTNLMNTLNQDTVINIIKTFVGFKILMDV